MSLLEKHIINSWLFYLVLLISLLLFQTETWAHAGPIKTDPNFIKATHLGHCEEMADTNLLQQYKWSDETALWQFEIINTPNNNRDIVFYLESPFYFESATQLPNSSSWQWYRTGDNQIDASWPASVAVYKLEPDLAVGDMIFVCNSAKLAHSIEAGIVDEHVLRKKVIEQVRAASLTEGTLFAMTIASLGLALLLRKQTFIMLTAGISMALLFVMVNNGSLIELPLGDYLLRDWHMQRFAGISSTILIGLGLARFLDFKSRHPQAWYVLLLFFGLIGIVLFLTIIPNPLRYVGISHISNALMIAIVIMTLGSAAVGVWKKHRPSIVLLLSWGPVLALTLWLGVSSYADTVWTSVARWLYPITLVYACSFLFIELARNISNALTQRDVARLHARTDFLTGAMTRGELDRRLTAFQANKINHGRDLALLFIDFDHFKKVNDTFGHAVGDAALVAAIDRIRSILRDDDCVGRYGGEEFVVMLEGTKAKSASEVAQRICKDIENAGEPIKHGLPPITVSIGVASYNPAEKDNMSSLIERADSALYLAKQNGRNQVVESKKSN